MLKKIVVVLVVLLVVVAFLLMRDYDSPELGQALLDEVGEATGIEMTATGFRFNLFASPAISVDPLEGETATV